MKRVDPEEFEEIMSQDLVGSDSSSPALSGAAAAEDNQDEFVIVAASPGNQQKKKKKLGIKNLTSGVAKLLKQKMKKRSQDSNQEE